MIQFPWRDDVTLPNMRRVRQHYETAPPVDVAAEVKKQDRLIMDAFALAAGRKVAVCVGSRGIADLCKVVREVVQMLVESGAEPFVTPAMGSHGGATAEGQIEVLKTRGITEESVGAPIMATMEVRNLGKVDGIPLFVDRLAYEADGIVPINRIKPHTEFSGPTESGLIKMLAIGLGNRIGAEHYHRAAITRGFYEIISLAGRELLKRLNILFGVALVENQDHQLVLLQVAAAGGIEAVEKEFLQKARAYQLRIPVDDIDLLIIDEMGKDISGAGIDPKVVGRAICSWADTESRPRVARIFVRDLTDASEGHASGIGMVDFTTERLIRKIDMQATAINALTSCCPEEGKIPMSFSSDREAVAAALMTIRSHTAKDVRIVRIKNTLELRHLLVSEGCLAELANKPDLEVDSGTFALEFDASGNLI